jgi:hypothetical protein
VSQVEDPEQQRISHSVHDRIKMNVLSPYYQLNEY